jgi:hypothetical protein
VIAVLAWTGALLTFGVGDVVTTVVGTRRAGLVEGAPLPKAVAGRQPTIPRLVGLKVVGFLVAFLGAEFLIPARVRFVVPVTVAVVGVVVTVYNLAMIRRARRFE